MSTVGAGAPRITETPGRERRRSPARWAIRLLPGLAAVVVGYRVLAPRRSELSGAAAALGHLRAPWLAAAVLAELGSLAAYAALQRRLLASADVAVARAPMLGITLAGYAIQNSLPAGPAWSAVFAFRELRRRGAGAVAVGWMLVLASVLSDVSLLALGLAGIILAEGHAAGYDVAEVVVGLAVLVAAVFAVLRLGPRSERGLALATFLLRWFRRLARRPAGDPQEAVRSIASRLHAVRPAPSDWARASTFALGNWVSDCACLALAFGAVGAAVPWRGLLLAYGTGQLAANLPITPGGLGVVEGSLSIALVFYGGAERTTVAAVLLYRIISFWSLLPVGWASWAVLRGISARRRARLMDGAA